MEVAGPSERVVPVYQTAESRFPEDCNLIIAVNERVTHALGELCSCRIHLEKLFDNFLLA